MCGWKALVAGPVSPRLQDQPGGRFRVAVLIKDLTGVEYHPGHVSVCWATTGSVANARSAARSRARRAQDPPLEAGRVACDKKSRQRGANPRWIHRRKRTEHPPHRVRTWAPRGQTPVIRKPLAGRALSIPASGLQPASFQIHPAVSSRPPGHRVLRHLPPTVPGTSYLGRRPLSAAAWFRATWPALMGCVVWVERLPAMPPNSNPVEYM